MSERSTQIQKPETKNKEALYDEHIYPLMEKIISVCKENSIDMVASFALDNQETDPYEPADPMFCTTIVLSKHAPTQLKEAYQALKVRRSPLIAMTITTTPTK